MITVYVPKNDFSRVRLGVIDGILGDFEKYHPEYLVRIAETIVREHKNEDITLRTHHALFIEALEVYGKYYGVKISFYLWEDIGVEEKIRNDNLKVIYKNLGDPYDIIDKISGKLIAKEIIGGCK